MKTLTALLAILTLGIFIAGAGMAAPDTGETTLLASGQATSSTTGPLAGTRNFSPMVKVAAQCLKRGKGGCDQTACSAPDYECQSNCCEGLICRSVSVPGGTGGTMCKP